MPGMRARRLNLRWWVVLVSIALVGCGGSDGGEHDSPAPTATPPPALATPQPTLSPTPRPSATVAPAFDEVVLAMATRYGADIANGGREFQEYILRHTGDGWDSIALTNLPRGAGLLGITFASTTVAYAYGVRGSDGEPGILLRSDDAGRSWRDLGEALPDFSPAPRTITPRA